MDDTVTTNIPAPQVHGRRRESLNRYRYRKAFAFALIVTFVTLIVLLYDGVNSYCYFRQTVLPESGLKETIGTITYLNEALTVSVRMAEATGDPRWEQRYRTLEPQLATAIQHIKPIAPGQSFDEIVRQTGEAYLALSKIEYRIVELVHLGRRFEADTLLASRDYSEQKYAFATRLQQIRSALNELDAEHLAALRQELFISLVLTGAALPLLVFAWAGVHRLFREHDMQHRRVEDALKETEERFRALVEHVPIGIVVAHEDIISYANSIIVRILGAQDEKSLRGRSIYDFIPPELHELARQRRKNLNQFTSTAKLIEFKLTRFEGTFVDVEVLPVHIMYGGRPAILNLISNISERNQAETALRSSMDQLHALTARLESVREEERRSLSQETHDQLGQILTAINMELTAIKRLESVDHLSIEKNLDSALQLTDNAVGIVQDISAKLRPRMLDNLGLLAAIEWQTEDFERRSGIQCVRVLPGEEPDIDEPRATALFRILQESLTNVVRHARASLVRVELSDSANEIHLTVRDDGVGITDEILRNPNSIGLLGIQERLRPFNGKSTIRRASEGGTEVFIRIPRNAQSLGDR